MSVLLIPTRNRPNSLNSVLSFISTFFPGRKIIVADGSNEIYRSANSEAIARQQGFLEIEYRQYDPDLGIIDRLLDVLCTIDNDIVTMGADDDYPQFDCLDKAEDLLRQDPSLVLALCGSVHLMAQNKEDNHINARLVHSFSIKDDDIAKRMLSFANWPYETTYAPTRREHLIERYQRAKESFQPDFHDFQVGIHDLAAGKIAGVPGIGFIGTRNYAHSYLRCDNNLTFLQHGHEVMQVYNQFVDDLMNFASLEEDSAANVANKLISTRIAITVGFPPIAKRDFEETDEWKNEISQEQVRLFNAMFRSGNTVREEFEERLLFIRDRLFEVIQSADNYGEKRQNKTFEAQISDGKNAATISSPIKLVTPSIDPVTLKGTDISGSQSKNSQKNPVSTPSKNKSDGTSENYGYKRFHAEKQLRMNLHIDTMTIM